MLKNLPGGVLLGFLLAPLFPCVLLSIFASLRMGEPRAVLFGTFIYAVFSYPSAWLFGIPTVFFLHKRKKLTLPNLLIAAVLLGALGGVMLRLLFVGFPALDYRDLVYWLIKTAFMIILSCAFALCTALAFWTFISFGTRFQRVRHDDQANLHHE